MHAFVRVNCRGHQASFVLYQNTINSLYHCLQPTVCTDMSEDTEDVKPKLSLVINYEGTQITVKVKHNMSFKKIFDAAEKRFGKEPGTFKFIYDGRRLRAENTPMDMEMEDGDLIDAHLEQLGGGTIIC
ncbi:ubiquitin-related domain-containing protein [Suillus tomentosus]|nr:ubiquitin-related domain-containing protein [Suillus tomentosus]